MKKLKFGTYTNLNLQNSIVKFTFSVFNGKYPFWASLVQKIKIFSLSQNLVPRLIRVSSVQWCWSLFQFPTCKFCPENPFSIWCYFVNLSAVYSQRLEASGLSYFNITFWNAGRGRFNQIRYTQVVYTSSNLSFIRLRAFKILVKPK